MVQFGQTDEEINLKLAASILFLAVAATAQTADRPSTGSTGAQQNEPNSGASSGSVTQQGDSQTTNGSQAGKRHKSKKRKHREKSESTGASSDANTPNANTGNANTTKAPTPSDGAQPNAPETTHQSQPPPERSKPGGTTPSP